MLTPHSRTAICQGAVIKGFLDLVTQGQSDSFNVDTLPIKVTSTVSRASYGAGYKCRFVPGTHQEIDKVWDDNECVFMAGNQMEWYLKRGSIIFSGYVSLEYKANYPTG